MAETRGKTQKQSRDAQGAQEGRRRPEAVAEDLSSLDIDASFPAGMLGSAVIEEPVEMHARLLRDSRFSGSANAAQKAQLTRALQHGHGNAYVQGLLASQSVQAKLTVNPPDDQYEREADRVADMVARLPDSKIQRQADQDDEEETQAKRVVSRVPEVSEELEGRINAAKGSGQSLPDSTRGSFEPHLGRDLSNVRIHTDSEADSLSRELGAQAFTTGHDVFFTQGAYQPESENGRRLLSHETAHVVQQGQGNRSAAYDKRRPNVRETIHYGQGRVGEQGLVIQRQTEARDAGLVRELNQHLAQGGLTVAFYQMPAIRGHWEFERQAKDFAEDHNAVGLSAAGRIEIGKAIAISAEVDELLERVTGRAFQVVECARRGGISPIFLGHVPVKTLAIFTHGTVRSLQARPSPDWIGPAARRDWARDVSQYLAPNVKVILYACSVSRTPAGRAARSFARALQLNLSEFLQSRHGPEETAVEVWGHTTAQHTTRNPNLRVFSKTGSIDLLDNFARRMLDDAIYDVDPYYEWRFTRDQYNSLHADARNRFNKRIMYVASGEVERCPYGPAVAEYVREIPFRTVDEVWEEIRGGNRACGDAWYEWLDALRFDEAVHAMHIWYVEELREFEKRVLQLRWKPLKFVP